MYHDLLASSTKPRVPAVVAQLAIGFQGYSKTRGRRACVKNEGLFP
jgi:hypothetical protein